MENQREHKSSFKRGGMMTIPKHLKILISKISLRALGATFVLTSHFVPEMNDEISDWEDNRRISIGVLPSGPFITIQKTGKRFRFLGNKLNEPQISILFKNLDSAMMIFTGQIGAAQAVAEHRICIHGNNYHAMQVTRAMAIVQTYLFPEFILKKTFKRIPKLNARQLAVKAFIMGLLTPKMLFDLAV